MDRMPLWVRQHLAALRVLLLLTVVLGIAYPLLITAVAQIPGVKHRADGSLVQAGGTAVGSALLGQAFTDRSGNPIAKYFQSRPSAAGAGYDPTATGASNLGPEEVVDTLPDPAVKGDTRRAGLLSTVCARSLAAGRLEGVDGRRPYCTAGGVGAVLSVIRAHGLTGPVETVVSVNQECPARPFVASFDGVPVRCAKYGVDYRVGRIVLVHGPGRAWPANPVPPDAVTASGSGLDPNISVAYARLQTSRVAEARGLPRATVLALAEKHTAGRPLGFMGEPAVNVLELNLALDRLRAR
jgi:K+-transporting ATPase ATPase C chain